MTYNTGAIIPKKNRNEYVFRNLGPYNTGNVVPKRDYSKSDENPYDASIVRLRSRGSRGLTFRIKENASPYDASAVQVIRESDLEKKLR